MEKIIVVGSSGHAKVVVDVVRKEKKYEIIGLIDRYEESGSEKIGYPILGRETDLPRLLESYSIKGVIVAIGDNFTRSKVAKRIHGICPNLPFVSAIHPQAIIADDVSVLEGTVIMAGAVINSGSSIGRCCILNTNSAIEHDTTVADFASLAPAVVTGGRCSIGERSAICIGAVLSHQVHIGADTIIGAASLVLNDVAPLVVAYGAPVKVMRSRTYGEKYL